MNTRPYIHDDPILETSPRGKSGYGVAHIVGLAAVAAILSSALLLS